MPRVYKAIPRIQETPSAHHFDKRKEFLKPARPPKQIPAEDSIENLGGAGEFVELRQAEDSIENMG